MDARILKIIQNAICDDDVSEVKIRKNSKDDVEVVLKMAGPMEAVSQSIKSGGEITVEQAVETFNVSWSRLWADIDKGNIKERYSQVGHKEVIFVNEADVVKLYGGK